MTEDRWSIKEREDKMTKHFDLELDLGGRHMEDKDLDQLVAQLLIFGFLFWSSFQNPGNN